MVREHEIVDIAHMNMPCPALIIPLLWLLPQHVHYLQLLELGGILFADWDDLPADVKAAAVTLGYTKEIWDSDGEPDSHDSDWAELSEAQKEAAKKLGYTPEEWDEE